MSRGWRDRSDAMVAELPKDEKPMSGHGHGGMGDMDM